MELVWKDYNSSETEIANLSKSLNIDYLLAKILVNRSIDKDTARRMLNDYHECILDPRLLINAEKAASIIKKYLDNKNAVIYIFADYDADGITSGYILADVLRKISKCKVIVYYPERREGYGISNEFANRIISDNTNSSKDMLVITVDNGISKKDVIDILQENNIEVIVTDHHTPGEGIPDCLIVDPFYNDNGYYKYLAGCGVAFKVAELVLWLYDRGAEMIDYTYAVAIGTLGDIMPMSPENMSFINYGIDQMNGDNCPAGIKAFKDYTGKKRITSKDIAWDIVPRVNACGRMDDVNLASKLFFTDDLKYQSEIDDVINYIEKTNENRKNLTKRVVKSLDTIDFSKSNVCIIDCSDYPVGILGIIAGKVVDKYNKPAIAFAGSGDLKTASSRCPDGYNIHELLIKERKLNIIENFGGHEHAAGFKFYIDRLNDLKVSINNLIETVKTEVPDTNEDLYIDSTIAIKDITESNYNLINSLPYDKKIFTAPIFMLKGVTVSKTPTYSKNNPSNMKLSLLDDTGHIDVWAWGMAEKYSEIGSPTNIDIACEIDNDFMNKKRFTIRVIDFKAA